MTESEFILWSSAAYPTGCKSDLYELPLGKAIAKVFFHDNFFKLVGKGCYAFQPLFFFWWAMRKEIVCILHVCKPLIYFPRKPSLSTFLLSPPISLVFFASHLRDFNSIVGSSTLLVSALATVSMTCRLGSSWVEIGSFYDKTGLILRSDFSPQAYLLLHASSCPGWRINS